MSNAKFKRSQAELAKVRACNGGMVERPETYRAIGVRVDVSRRLVEKKVSFIGKDGKRVYGKVLGHAVKVTMNEQVRRVEARGVTVELESGIGERTHYDWTRGF
jgi:hypothetical protein